MISIPGKQLALQENAQIGFLIFSIGCGVGLEATRRKTSVRLVIRKPRNLVLQWESHAEVSPSAVFCRWKRVACPHLSWWLADLRDFVLALSLLPFKKEGEWHAHAYIHTLIHTDIHIHTLIHTEIHIHTHTLNKSSHLFAVFSVVSERISGFCFITTNQLWMKKSECG